MNSSTQAENGSAQTHSISRRIQIYFYALSMLTSFLNLLYYPIVSRLLPISVYGEVQFLVTILFQISVLFLALNIISILFSLQYKHDTSLLSRKTSALSSALNLATSLLTILLVIILSLAHKEFHFNSILPFIALGIAIVSTVPFTIGIGQLQGRNLYVHAGTMNTVGAGLKLIFSVLFIVAGFSTTGAILGIAIGQVTAVLIFSRRRLLPLSELLSLNAKSIYILRPDSTLLATSMCVVVINLIMTADTIGAKILLSPDQAGLYAGIATLAKIAIFIVSPLMWLVIPAATSYAMRKKTVIKQIGIATLLCILLTLAYTVAGRLFVSLVVGTKYLPMESLLLFSTVAASSLAIAAMLNVILISNRRYVFSLVQTGLMTLGFIAVLTFNDAHTVKAILSAQLVSGGLGILYYFIVDAIAHED